MSEVTMPRKSAQGRAIPITTPMLCVWALVGGALVVVVDNGLFHAGSIREFLSGSAPSTQILAFAISGLLIAATSVAWTLAHRPIHSEKVALQLGLVAPAAISTLLAASTPPQPNHDVHAFLERIGQEFVISSAVAQPNETTEPTTPSPWDCIVGGVIRQPC